MYGNREMTCQIIKQKHLGMLLNYIKKINYKYIDFEKYL